MLTIFIFSRDRACQLDLLLRSIKKSMSTSNLPYKVMTLCKITSDDYAKGYAKLWRCHPDVSNYIEADSFREDAIFLLNEIRDSYTMILVDDDVFIRHSIGDEIKNALEEFDYNDDAAALSTRLGKRITFWYEKQETVIVPELTKMRYTYKWEYSKGYGVGGWNSWYSLDGNVFITEELLGLVSKLKFGSPNTLEAAMRNNPMVNKPTMLCLESPLLVGVPMNRVQVDWATRSSGISAKELNRAWLSGNMISVEQFWNKNNTSVHVDYPTTDLVIDERL